MEIEKVAEETPELSIKTRVDIAAGLTAGNIRKMTAGLGFTENQFQKFAQFCRALYNVYMDLDCSLIEINPLVLTVKAI